MNRALHGASLLLLGGLGGMWVTLVGGCSKPLAGGSVRSHREAPRSAAPEAGRDSGGQGLSAASIPCGGFECFRFESNEEAFRWVLGTEPSILGIGEAHAQKGSEAFASATKRFTESMLPVLQNRASDLLVEAWAGDPGCNTAVKQVGVAQKQVTRAQAETNPNEYLVMGARARALGITPYLLRPSCDDFARLADAGDSAVTESLLLIKRLTQSRALALFDQNGRDAAKKLIVTYGGAMHNDLAPLESLRPYSFGPELAAATAERYVELDLIVPEYIKKNDVWDHLPWAPAYQAYPGPKDKPLVIRLFGRSFVMIFAIRVENTPPDPLPSRP